MKKVAIIDYGIGNILSVIRAFEHCGAEAILVDNVKEIKKADRLILPGVGAFADGMCGLQSRGLLEAIKDFVYTERPFMGICLGMQMMLEVSEEFGLSDGLGIIPGKVAAIPQSDIAGCPHKIPHIGWNELLKPSSRIGWNNTILDGLEPGVSTYFIHSFAAFPSNPENCLAECNYNGWVFSAAIRYNQIYGCQFHPEKSGVVGLKIIQNFLNL